MATALRPFPSFYPSPDAGTPGLGWEKYVARFKNLITALDIKKAERQKALLLHYVGEETNDIFDTLIVSEPADGETVFDIAVNAITSYLKPKRNIPYEDYLFRQAKQDQGETIMAYCTQLKQLAKTCEFTDTDREIKSQIIQNCPSTKLRRKALTNSTITLQALLDLGKTMELTDIQAASLEKQSTRWSEKSTAQHEAKAAESLELDGGIQAKGRGIPGHRQVKNVDTAADHTHTRVTRQAALPTARIVAIAAN